MSFRRELFGSYLLVGGGLVAGLLIGVLVLDTRPAVVGWFFGAGAGLAGGAFIAAVTSDMPLAGSGGPRPGSGTAAGSDSDPGDEPQLPGVDALDHENGGFEGGGQPPR
ncbi:MAG: hypothetical protein QF664_12235 [Dehalococcoidia bacterium]|jgi:hypothetical protein|nr:hypothetical protein [Dehalococcoidia bacterium]